MKKKRHFPIGAEIIPLQGVDFRVWTPETPQMFLSAVINNDWIQYPMQKEKGGYFSFLCNQAKSGTLYYFKTSKEGRLLPDPASRFQPEGPMGPSQVIDPFFHWTDEKWKGAKIQNQIFYEMHIGTFTSEGTFKAAIPHLKELVDLGITAIEIMPLNEFAGSFGWGYDGVNLFAPTHLYGSPEDLRVFINEAHRKGLAVILDVVYNHLGPEGNSLASFSQQYFNEDNQTDWGASINFDLFSVREFFLTNVRYWLIEFHFDGLRIDATPQFFCSTTPHILEEIRTVAKKALPKKSIIIIGECEKQEAFLLHSLKEGGYGFDALWNDDFHHTARVRLTGKREAYYTDYLGNPQEFISSIKYGFLYQGQYYSWQKKGKRHPRFKFTSLSSCHLFRES